MSTTNFPLNNDWSSQLQKFEKKPTLTLERKPTVRPTPVLEKKPTYVLEKKPTYILEKKPTMVLEKKPTMMLEKKPTVNLDRNLPSQEKLSASLMVLEKKPTIMLERKPTANLDRNPTSQEKLSASFKDDKHAHFVEKRSGTSKTTSKNNIPLPNQLSEVKEVREDQISPRKHKFLNDIAINKNPANETEHGINVSGVHTEKKEDEGIFSNFFAKFKSKKQGEQPTPGILTRTQIEQSEILREIYTDDLQKPLFDKDKDKDKGKLASSRLLANLNDIMEPDQGKKPNGNSDLDHFLKNRNSMIQMNNPQLDAIQQPILSHSFYEKNPTQPMYDVYRPPLASSLTPMLPNNEIYKPSSYSSYTFNKYNNFNYQPTVRNHMSNEEVKQYLRNLDGILSESLKKHPRPQDDYFEYKPKSYVFEEPPIEKSSIGLENPRSSGVRLSETRDVAVFEDNEELEDLREKYANSYALKRSGTLLKMNLRSTELSAFTDMKIGDILCANCEEFIASDDLDQHSKGCNRKIEDMDLKRLNQKIEKMKYLLIINFKNVEPANKQSYVELEELMNLGIVIIDEILSNNKSGKRLKESLIDLDILINNLPTLKNKNSNVFKVLCDRVIQLASRKIIILLRTNPEDPKPLRIELPKKKQDFIMRRKVIKSEGFCGRCCGGCCGMCSGGCCGDCGGCCNNEKEVYVKVPAEGIHVTARNRKL